MLGKQVDFLNMQQEENAQSSKYVVAAHEFELNKLEEGVNVGGYRLNEYGEDHTVFIKVAA
jgi:hypothetical protein